MNKGHRVRLLGFLLPFAAVLIFSLTLQAQSKSRGVTSTQPNQDPKASSGSQSAPPAKDADYVGAEACKVCHEDIYNGWEKTPHFRTTLDTKGGPSHQGCEACHGPGKAHSETGDKTKIFIFKNVSADESSKRCLTCHASGKEQMDFGRSVHHKNDVSCVDCHSPHHAKVSEFMLVNKQPDLCYTCHAQQKPQFVMPFHHRVNEGL